MILGLSFNSRIVGVAVVENGTLVDYRVRLFKERWGPEKLEKMISAIVTHLREYPIEKCALLLPPRHHTNTETNALLSRLKIQCKNTKLSVCYYKIQQLHTLHDNSRAKKKALMQALSSLYPELSLARKKELTNRKRYYMKLFEAVGVATMHEKSLEA